MKKPVPPRKALGKGIGALLMRTRTDPVERTDGNFDISKQEHREELSLNVDINRIDANPLQPRRIFQSDRMEELAQSIRANGIIQPLVVRRQGDRYQLVAGERRWRAAKLAAVAVVPIVIRDIPDDRLLEITLIENIQREDLSPVETASAFHRMATELALNPEQIGTRTGKDRSTVVNFIRLLQLPADIQQLINDRKLTAGHGRCLLTLTSGEAQREVAERAAAQGWSVRETERVTQRMVEGRKSKTLAEIKIDPNVKAAVQEMERVLGTRVRIIEGARGKGKIEIEYYSAEDLDRIYGVITGEE
jgi:ParB family chromosome partitioning protein